MRFLHQCIYFSDAEFQTVAIGRWSGSDIDVRINRNDDFELIRAATRLREATTPYWQKAVWLEELGQPALDLNVPIRRGETFIGAIIIIIVCLDSLVHFVTTLRDSEAGGNAFILLGREHVLAHPTMADGSWRRTLSKEGTPLARLPYAYALASIPAPPWSAILAPPVASITRWSVIL